MIALTILCLAVLALLAWREREHGRERAELIQRIQAPERAVRRFEDRKPRERRPARVVSAEDDKGMIQAIEARERERGTSAGTD